MKLTSRILALLTVACWLLAGMGLQQATAAPLATNIDFTGFTGAGFSSGPGAPPAGQLDSDTWSTAGFGASVAFGADCFSGDCARGSSGGGVNTGGVYAFEVSTGNVALGVQPGGSDFTPGSFTLRTRNNTGSVVNSVDVSYLIWVLNDQPRENSFNFSYSTDSTGAGSGAYTSVGALDFASPSTADGSPAWSQTARSTTLTGLNLANGDYLYLRWTGDDVSGSLGRDEFALDDIIITQVDPTAVQLSQFGTATGSMTFSLVLFVMGVLAAGTAVVLRRQTR